MAALGSPVSRCPVRFHFHFLDTAQCRCAWDWLGNCGDKSRCYLRLNLAAWTPTAWYLSCHYARSLVFVRAAIRWTVTVFLAVLLHDLRIRADSSRVGDHSRPSMASAQTMNFLRRWGTGWRNAAEVKQGSLNSSTVRLYSLRGKTQVKRLLTL
jgi:hypothetical protein